MKPWKVVKEEISNEVYDYTGEEPDMDLAWELWIDEIPKDQIVEDLIDEIENR